MMKHLRNRGVYWTLHRQISDQLVAEGAGFQFQPEILASLDRYAAIGSCFQNCLQLVLSRGIE